MGNFASQLGGLAALAGVKVPGGGDRSEAVAVLKSQEVAAGFIAKHQLLPELYPSKWDAAAKKWKSKEPRLPLAIKKFSQSMRDIVEDIRIAIAPHGGRVVVYDGVGGRAGPSTGPTCPYQGG